MRLPGDMVNEAAETVRVTVTFLTAPPPVTVMAAVCVPTGTPPRLMLAETVPFPDPEVGLSVSQLALSLAVQVPFEVTVIDWLAGLGLPDMAV